MTHRSVPIEVSARHIHLSPEHLAALFGNNAALTVFKKISQPGQFAANEAVTILGSKGRLNLRVVGPARPETQVELSSTDAIFLGLKPALRVSGDLNNTSGCRLQGPAGKLELNHGVVVAQRHLHISPQEAYEFGLKHGDIISIKTESTRPVTFHNVYVRSRDGIDELSFMIDTDEANAAGLKGGEKAVIMDNL
ncbi:MAG: hypothetical protein A2388_01620 [Candidatus Veblenbacteria bacterium RIFOXYB1_FULL_43_13]|uniref:Phosphate propanoyltransferase n=1 Tax=Candidatus Veblenbacteria bacterium RIFOXYB1_FULL_43_13 TaxID=1802426 RepID=A0A1G2Q2J9_9BACT|nr:MAG: hypothetical protein A2388_01620 [Candidatus Veblenbacteria bacterium RIFOXYB1_FULL_43_13]